MDDDLETLEALAAHLGASEDAGEDGRISGELAALFGRLKDARTEAREAERHAAGEDTVPMLQAGAGHWSVIVRDAPEYLRRSKDIDVAAWLLEASVRLHGFAGVAIGMRILSLLVMRFWHQGAWPRLSDEVTGEDRTAPLTALNGIDRPGTLIQPVSMLAITAGQGEHYAYWQYEAALALGRLADKEARDRRISAGAVSSDMFVQSLLGTPASELKRIFDQVEQALADFRAMQAMLRNDLGDDAPPGSFILGLLEGISNCLLTQATHVTFRPPPEADVSTMDEVAVEGMAGERGHGTAMTRSMALDRVHEIADWFERHEPNGLVGISLREVVRRARLPLIELLSELIPADDSRRDFLLRAGIRPNDDYPNRMN